MVTQLEKAFLILLLLGNYGTSVPGLLRHGWIGAPALAVGFAMVSLFVALLLRSSAKAALFLFLLAIIGFSFTVIQYFVAGSMLRMRPSTHSVELFAAISLAAAYCAFDLWSKWQKPTPR